MSLATAPLLSERVSIEVALERAYAGARDEFDQFAMTEDATAQAANFDLLSRTSAMRSTGTVPVSAVPLTQPLPDLVTELDGSLDIWTALCRAGGMSQSAGDTGSTVFRFDSYSDDSVAVRTNVDGMIRTTVGVRGSAEFAAVAMGPLTFRLAGPVGLPGDVSFGSPPSGFVTLGAPIRLCNAGFALDVENVGVVVPRLKSFRIAAKRVIVEQRGRKRLRAVNEIVGVSRVPTWECLIEQDRAVNWEDVLSEENPVGLSMTLSGPGGSLEFRTPRGRSAFLTERPQYQGVGSVFGVGLVFGLSGRQDADLEVIRRPL